jgi:hypothetical protein
VSLRDKISNPLLQTLDALSALYQLITGKFHSKFSAFEPALWV